MNYIGFKAKWYGRATCWRVNVHLRLNTNEIR